MTDNSTIDIDFCDKCQTVHPFNTLKVCDCCGEFFCSQCALTPLAIVCCNFSLSDLTSLL